MRAASDSTLSALGRHRDARRARETRAPIAASAATSRGAAMSAEAEEKTSVVAVTEESSEAFKGLKLRRKHKFVVFKIDEYVSRS